MIVKNIASGLTVAEFNEIKANPYNYILVSPNGAHRFAFSAGSGVAASLVFYRAGSNRDNSYQLTGVSAGSIELKLSAPDYDTVDISMTSGTLDKITGVNDGTNWTSLTIGSTTKAIPAAQVNADWNAASGVAQILNKPNLATVATTGAYSDLSGTPSLAAVATSGSYADLSNKPTILGSSTETWTFTLSDNTTVTKTVVLAQGGN